MTKPYTVQEAADFLQIAESTLRRMIQAGMVKCGKVGVGRLRKHYRFTEQQVQDALVTCNDS